MKKTLCMFFALLLVVLTACQPTPAEEIVHQKGAENEKKWMEPAPIQEVEVSVSGENPDVEISEEIKKGIDVPEHWEEKLDLRADLKVEIEADITVPPTTVFPIYAVEPVDFDRDKLDNIVKTLYPNTRLQIKPPTMSKEEIEYEMEIETKAIENIDRNHPNFTEEEREEYIAEAQAHLQNLLKQLQALENGPAPEVAERVSDYIHREDGSWLTVFEPIDEKTGSKLGTIDLNTAPKGEEDNQRMQVLMMRNGAFQKDGEVLNPDILDFDAVRNAAEELLRYLGLDEMYEVDRVFQNKYMYPDATFVYCTRRIGDARITYVDTASRLQEGEGDPAYAPGLDTEDIRMLFRSYGCDDFIWSTPTKTEAVENENVQLLPFETIQEKARKAFGRILYPNWGGDNNVLYYRIIINDIRLGYMNVKRAGGGYSAIPVWNFFGYYYGGYASQKGSGWAELDENNEHKFDARGGAISMLTLNAIDGSIINHYIGY